MFITKKRLSRRTLLRGAGAALALPLLDAMVPALTALSQTAAAPARLRRLGVFYVPNGMSMGYWWPEAEGPPHRDAAHAPIVVTAEGPRVAPRRSGRRTPRTSLRLAVTTRGRPARS